MSATKVFIYGLFFILILSAFFGCTQENMGIYYSLEVEKDLEGDKGLDDSLKVWEMIKAGDTYYIAAGKVYRRGFSDESWAELGPPESGMLSSDITFFNDTIFCIYRSADGNTSKLYSLNTNDYSWTALETITADKDDRITGVIALQTVLYVSVLNEDVDSSYKPYSLHFTEDGTNFTLVDLPGDNDYSVRIISDGDFDGTNYWLVSGDTILSGTSPGSLTETISPNDTNGNDLTPANIGGIYYCEDIDKIFISSKEGTVIFKNQPSTGILADDWYQSESALSGDDYEVFYDFTKVTVPGVDQTESIIVIVGSDSGYYEINVDSAADADTIDLSKPTGFTNTTTINYLNTKLAVNSIRNFLFDPVNSGYDDDVIFACTTSSGLWRNAYNASSGARIWSIE